MIEPVSIKESTVKDDSTDLNSLKEQGLRKIQELAGNQWTDYNFHDPGVTILEILCYALTDLAYRADFDISDLLYTEGRSKLNDSLFPPEEILTTAALSILDLKRLILDLEGVKNCSLIESHHKKVIQGVFDIQVEIHPDYEDESFRKTIANSINELLQKNRPLGISFNEPVFMEHEPVGIVLDLELTNDVDPKKIFSEFIQCVQNYFSPEIKFRSLQELRDRGVPVETTFNGPLLENGFLLDEDLVSHSLKQQIFVSDLMSLVMAIPGVSFVRELKILEKGNKSLNWIYNVPSGKVPKLDPDNTTFVCYYKNTKVYESDKQSIHLWFSPNLNRTSSHRQNTLNVPKGISRNLKKYHSIQNDFPETYGVGNKGPSAGASAEKLGAIKQFKGYLFIYDQIMTNFLAQLDHVKYLFSTEDIDNSYAVQLIDDIPGIEFMYRQFVENYLVAHNDFTDRMKLKSEWIKFLKEHKDRLTRQIQNARETKDEFLRRRNELLNHLLARFGVETFKIELLSGMHPAEAISYKLDLIRNFPALSAEKHITGSSSVNSAVSGIQCWIGKNLNLSGAHKIGITNSLQTELDPERPASGVKIEMFSGDKPLNTFLKQVSDIDQLIETGANEISLYNKSKDLISKITVGDASILNKREFVFSMIKQMDRDAENILIIDHIMLKPDENMPCFGFNVLADKSSYFISERKYTFRDCNAFADEFTQLCSQKSNRNNFSIIETAMKEFRVKFNCSYGNLLTRSYYSSRAEAEEKLDYFLESYKGQTIPDYLFFTKYEDHYINLSNPFSYIITILIPTWPSKFQNEAFLKYMEEYLYEELPSHLVVNIKRLDFEEMRTVEKYLDVFTNAVENEMPHNRIKALDALMSALIS